MNSATRLAGLLASLLFAGSTLAQTLACNPSAPRSDPGTGFVVVGAADQVYARGGNSGSAWEWALDNAHGNLDWTSGKTFQWSVTYAGSGAATLEVRDAGTLVLSLSKSSGMNGGNAATTPSLPRTCTSISRR
jgi:hypothetical protein